MNETKTEIFTSTHNKIGIMIETTSNNRLLGFFLFGEQFQEYIAEKEDDECEKNVK